MVVRGANAPGYQAGGKMAPPTLSCAHQCHSTLDLAQLLLCFFPQEKEVDGPQWRAEEAALVLSSPQNASRGRQQAKGWYLQVLTPHPPGTPLQVRLVTCSFSIAPTQVNM